MNRRLDVFLIMILSDSENQHLNFTVGVVWPEFLLVLMFFARRAPAMPWSSELPLGWMHYGAVVAFHWHLLAFTYLKVQQYM